MNRSLDVEYAYLKYIDGCSNDIERDEPLSWEKVHMSSSARTAYLLAIIRGENPELAACATAIHDIGRVLTGKQSNHAEEGYAPAKKFLSELKLFSDEEIEIMACAVKNHSKKTETGTPLEEIVKDADVIDCYQYGIPFDREEKRVRYNKCANEIKAG